METLGSTGNKYCLIPYINCTRRVFRRMQWSVAVNFLRSRVFLLGIILLLTGFLTLHYITPLRGLDVVVSPLPEKQVPLLDIGLASNRKSVAVLYKDKLEQPKPENSENDVVEISKNFTEKLPENNTLIKTRNLESVENLTCTKKVDVSFLKVHKAGSTTVMNIFMRFAISNRLNIVLPPKSSGFGFNYLGYGKTVSKNGIVPLPKNESHYNILFNHVVYNKNAFRSILPNDTVYVGILREPVSHFISAASYYGFFKSLQEQTSLSQFLANPSQFKLQTYFVYNRMSFDLGIPKEQFNNEKFVENYIKELDADYELMMILEHFHESLILLRRTLCWDTKSILYVPLNSRGQQAKVNLGDEDIENLRKWNAADFKLYNHFYNVFQRKLAAHGQDLLDEVESFKSIQSVVKSFCSVNRNEGEILTVEKTKWDEGFIVTEQDCKRMTEHELVTMPRLINQAWEKYNNSLKK